MKKLSLYISLLCLILTAGACKNKTGGPATASSELTDDALMDTVQRRTFLYFWEGAEPNSGLAPERYHVDGVYPQNDANVVTSGGSGVLHRRALHWIWYGSKQWAEDRAASGVMCAGSIIYQSIIWKLNSTR